MRAKIIWGTMGIVLFLVLGFATLKIAKATTCEPDGTLVVIEGTWENGGDGYDYCKGKSMIVMLQRRKAT